MFVTTFYSFKGGVGRTLSMANVAVLLAQSGRSVLVVDFDLEAPGIDTFREFAPLKPNRGVVDFVHDALEDGATPDVSAYVYTCTGIGARGGVLRVMPAGIRDEGYARRLADINWRQLYEHGDGFLIFEDLKQQWEDRFSPDYVLIDSRTGHSDEAGICTRQLPDCVVALFFPNAQNLEGLEKAVSDIRAESQGVDGRRIELVFVMSNVPDLDDEDHVISDRLGEFGRRLQFSEPPERIHHYNSLALLNQSIFAIDRRRSRLAQEYRHLTTRIRRLNSSDREGARRFLADLGRARTRRPIEEEMSASAIEDRLLRIQVEHSEDGEILYLLARHRMQQGELEQAREIFWDAQRTGEAPSDVWLRRAECARSLGLKNEARDDALAYLREDHGDLQPFDVIVALRILRQVDPESLSEIAETNAVEKLRNVDRVWIARNLARSARELSSAWTILQPALDDRRTHEDALQAAKLILIGLGRFDEALEAFSDSSEAQPSLPDAFNRAMATWGRDGQPDRSLFAEIVRLSEGYDEHEANFFQCMALANHVIGNSADANEFLSRARTRAIGSPQPMFSCWRYREVGTDAFLDDLRSIESLMEGADEVPKFISRLAAGE